MDEAKNMDYCGLGYIVKGVKKMKRRTNTTSSTAVENDIRNDSFHTLLSKLNIVEKKLEKLDKSLPMVAEGVCSVELDGSKLKVELPGNWVDILREYEASGSRPCLEVSFIRDLNKESPTQDLAGVGCLRVAKGSMPGINAKSCSCEKAIQKEKMDVLFENDATLGTSVLLSQSVRKQSNPLRAFSEDITGIPFVPRGSDRSCPSLVSKIQRALSRSKLNYVIPAPLRDESEPSTTSVMSAPADCHSCGFPWKVLFDSTDSSHTHHCRVHSNPPGCEHSQVNVFEEAVISSSNEAEISARTQFQNMDTERVLPPVQPQEEFVRAGATKSCELIAAEENTEFEGQGELQEANLVNTDDPELIKRDASPRFLLPRLDFVRPGIQRPSNFVPEMSVSTTTFQTASIGHPISRLFIDEGTVLSSHPSDPLDPPRGTAANPNGDRVKKGMFISITPYEGTPKHLKSPSKNETFDEQLQEKSAVNPSHSETPGTPEPSPTVGISIQERIEPTGCSKPLNFDSGEIAEFPVNYSTELNDILNNEKDSDFESTLVEEFINGAMMESLLSHLASKPTYNDDDLYNATSELLRKSHETAIVHEDHFIKNTPETKSKYMSSRSEVLRRTKFRQSLRSQLVMALRVDNDRPKNLCVGKMARALMDSKNERTRRWIEEIPHKWVVGSRTKLNRLPSPKRDRNSKKGSIKNIRIINSMLATSDISMRKRNTGTVVVRPDYARRNRKVSGSYRRHHSSSPDRTTLKGKHHRRRKHSQVIGSVKNSDKTTENLRGNAQSDEVLDKPLKILLPGMCIMGAFEKAKNKFRNKRVNSTSVHAKDKPGYPKETNDGDNNAKDTKNKMKSTHDYRRSHRMNTSSAKHPITMPVSQVRIVDHRHRRGFTNRESEKDDEEYTNVNGRFGERCKHPDCEKQRSPASFSDMLSRTRALRLERNADRRKQARHSQHQRQSSSEDSVIYQRLPGLKDRAKEHYRPRRVENVHYRRGYLLDSLPGRRNQSQEEGDDHNFEHRDQHINSHPQHRRDYEHRLSRNHQHHHNRDHRKPKPARVKRRALLRESSSSSNSSSEALVISRPNTQSPIPKPRPKVDFIETKPRVTLPRKNARYAVESVEPSRFHRAYQKESHVRKHHAPLVRDILRLNRQIHHQSGLHKNAETKRNNKDSSESAPSSESEEYAHNRYDKSAPGKTREGNIYQAHARAKAFANSGAKKGLRLMERLSQRRLESSDSKSSAGYDQINVKDFVDFLVTLSRNTVGTLTNKRKAMSLYKSYLNGEYKTGRVDKGDLVSRIKKAHHRQK